MRLCGPRRALPWLADRVWTIGDLLEAALSLEPNRPVRIKRQFTVIDGGKP